MDECLQIHGGAGYMVEYDIERAARDARLGPIGGGTDEIMKEFLGHGPPVFVQTELHPHAREWEEARWFPNDVFLRLAELGYIGLEVRHHRVRRGSAT